jgi:hypothetical protein
MLLSQVLANIPTWPQKDAEAKRIMLRVADGLEHIRYARPELRVIGGFEHYARTDGLPRHFRLPDAVLRYGEVDGFSSSLFFNGRRWASDIELFLLDVATETDEAPTKPKLGRPTLKDQIQEEGRRLQATGARYRSCRALAKAVLLRIEGAALNTALKHLKDIWLNPN